MEYRTSLNVTTAKSFSRTHRIDKNDNIGITGFTMWKQKKNQQQNVTPLSIELTTSVIQGLMLSSLSHWGKCYLEHL